MTIASTFEHNCLTSACLSWVESQIVFCTVPVRGKVGDLFGAVYDDTPVFSVAEKPDNLRVIGVSNDYRVISVSCMSLYGRVHFGHALAGRIQKNRALFVKLLPAVGRNPMGADHHFLAGAALDPVFIENPLFPQHREDLPVMDEGPEGADVLTLLAVLNGVHGDFDSAPDPFAKACRFGYDDLHCLPSNPCPGSRCLYGKTARRPRKPTFVNTNFEVLWQPVKTGVWWNRFIASGRK
jgi:hypothetical protein